MSNVFHRHRGFALACFLLLGFSACENQPEEATGPELSRFRNARPADPTFSVYTQNMYLGGDTGPLFTLDFTDQSLPNLITIVGAVNGFWAEVQSSNIPERVAAIVDEIGARMPQVVGLQEVLQFAVVDLSSGTPTIVGGIDMLATLEAEILARGLPYEIEVARPTTSSNLPLGLDPSVPGSLNPVLAFTDHEVLLRRKDVELLGKDDGVYDAAATFGPVRVDRGWGRVTVDYRGTPHHVISTHLEVQLIPQIQALQAQQLMGEVMAGLEGVTVLVGDLNSDAEAGPGEPSWTPTYEDLLAAGFTDVWDRSPTSRRSDGFTCCHDDLSDPSGQLDERIDFVLVRPSGPRLASRRRLPGVFFGRVVGEETADLTTPTGLWPSDHAGLIANFRLPLGGLRHFRRSSSDDEG